tara:strand:+ start:190 stop:1230 length:1041 start_codon:yes stop_codon:yes gene_type:complete
MFRGGKVIDSRGTGITSGLMDGGRVGFRFGGRGAGPTFNPFAASQVPAGQLGGQISRRTAPTPDYSFLDTINISEFFKPAGIKGEGFKPRVNPGKVVKSREELEEENEELKSQQVDTGDLGVETENIAALEKGEKALEKNNNAEQKVELSAQDLIRENAELFKELLGEASKEDIKKARISDASDYLLKFFEGTSQGKGIKEAAGAVAGFATSKPSATERAREAVKKTDQTAVALAINDYIAGKRSKEDINKLLTINAAKIKMAEGTLGDKILKAKGSGPVTVTVIRDVLRAEPEYSGKSIEEFNSKDKDFKGLTYEAGDEDKIFIDTITKETFIYSPEIKDFKRIY